MKSLMIQLDESYQGHLDSDFDDLKVCFGESDIQFKDGQLVLVSKLVKKPFHIDFVSKKNVYRFSKVRNQPNLLAKALGGKQGSRVLDFTAGECTDALSLHFWGLDVVAFERSPLIYLLLKDARARAEDFLKKYNDVLYQRLLSFQIVFANSFEWAQENDLSSFEAVYIDPMFPEKKSSLSQKSMQVLQGTLEPTNDAAVAETIKYCLAHGIARVVVKRPLKAEAFVQPIKHSFNGKSIRFDMYCK